MIDKNMIIESKKKKNINTKELGKKINVDPAYLSRVENGKQKPSINILYNLSKELDIDFIKLLLSTYNHTEIEVLGIFNNINEVFNFVDEKTLDKVKIKDENENIRISLLKTLELYKNNFLKINETIGLLSCLTNKNLFDYLTEEEIKEINNKK